MAGICLTTGSICRARFLPGDSWGLLQFILNFRGTFVVFKRRCWRHERQRDGRWTWVLSSKICLGVVWHTHGEDTGKMWWGGVESPDPGSMLEEVMGWGGLLWSRFYAGGDEAGWCLWSRFYMEGSNGVEFLIRVLCWRRWWGRMTSPDPGSILDKVMGWSGVPWHRFYSGGGEAFIPMEMLLILMQDAQFC